MGLSLSGINELISLCADSIISIDKVEFWLLKYEDEYNHLKSLRKGELPSLSNYATAEDKFIDLYEQLDEMSRYHKFEPYCKEQLEIYALIKNDGLKIKEWFRTNESFYYEELIHFSVNYLDYLGNDKEYLLKIFSYQNKGLEFFIDVKDFESTIEFIEKFNQNI